MRPMVRWGSIRSILAAALATLGVAVAAHPLAAAGARADAVPGLASACAGAVQHPIEVRVRALDPVRRGAAVRLEVKASARASVRDAEVRLVSPGGLSVEGARRVALGRLSARGDAGATFRVVVPDQGRRFLVQFVVSGEGPAGPLTRGAVYNVLPDGPADPGRPVTATDGARIVEFAATRSGR